MTIHIQEAKSGIGDSAKIQVTFFDGTKSPVISVGDGDGEPYFIVKEEK